MMSLPSHALRRRQRIEITGGMSTLLRGLAAQMYEATEDPEADAAGLLAIAERWLGSAHARGAAGRSLELATLALRASRA